MIGCPTLSISRLGCCWQNVQFRFVLLLYLILCKTYVTMCNTYLKCPISIFTASVCRPSIIYYAIVSISFLCCLTALSPSTLVAWLFPVSLNRQHYDEGLVINIELWNCGWYLFPPLVTFLVLDNTSVCENKWHLTDTVHSTVWLLNGKLLWKV